MIALVTLALPVTAVGAALAFATLRALRMYREVRAVACPETHEPVAVRLDAPRAAVTAMFGKPKYRLTSCSRWPEKRDCEQACRSQVTGALRGCAAEAALEKLQRAQCALCGSEIRGSGPHGQKPVLMSPDRRRRLEWNAVPPEELLRTLATHSQVCWTCHMSESYRELRSARAADGPSRSLRPAVAAC